MGAFVFLDVHGADLHLVKGKTLGFEGQQHIGLILEPVAGHIHQLLYSLPGQSPQAGLGVGDGHAAEDLEYHGGGFVAEAAPGGDILLIEVPAAQHAVTGFQHMLTAGAGVRRVVLVVAVHGDYAQPVGAVFQKPPEGVLQGCALALVYLMVEKNNLRVGSGGVGKVVQILRLAAVVYQNDVGEAILQQAVNDGVQLFIRIQRGQNHGNIG